MKEKINPNVIFAVGALILVFFGGRKIFQALGLIQDQEERQREQQLVNFANRSFWDFEEFLSGMPQGALLLTTAKADEKAEQIYDAMGFFNDDEEEVYGVFRSLKTQSQIAWVAKRFFIQYGQDLYSFLDEYFNDEEMQKLYLITKDKPLYNV